MFDRAALRVVTLLVLLSPASHAAQRTFVSAAAGSDANPCTRALPCRGFAAAISQTDPAGEVVALDTGGYGALTITQSVALVAPPGVHAAITALTGNGIEVVAGSADVVIVRGLYLNGLGGFSGIDFASGKTLHVENCVFSGFADSGIFGQADDADVFVLDTSARLGGSGFVFLSSTSIRAHLASVRAEENTSNGFAAGDNAVVTVTGSIAAGNSAAGFTAASASAVLNIESSTATHNAFGVYASGTARVRNSMITGNTTGVFTQMSGNTISFGNNGLHGNVAEGSFTTTVAQQ